MIRRRCTGSCRGSVRRVDVGRTVNRGGLAGCGVFDGVCPRARALFHRVHGFARRLTHGDQHAARVREFLEGGYRALRELRDSGAVRAIGLGVNEWEICVELLEHCQLDCILLAGRYTLLEQTPLEKLLPLCESRGVSILCGGPFNSGILAAGSRAGASSHYDYVAPPPVNKKS